MQDDNIHKCHLRVFFSIKSSLRLSLAQYAVSHVDQESGIGDFVLPGAVRLI